MRVLVIADPHIPVPPVNYGGTERIVALLCDGLRRRGWTVDLMAGPGSQSFGGRLWVHRVPSRGYASRAYHKVRFQLQSLLATSAVDIVINHGRPDYFWGLYRTRIPIVNQFHHPIGQSEIDLILRQRRSRIRFVGVSKSQVKGIQPAHLFDTVFNATALESLSYSPSPTTPPYLAFLGRLTANKGVHLAIEAARANGLRLVIAGNVSREPGGEEYFQTKVKPHLGPEVEWIGPVNDVKKQSLLGKATALLFPIQWPEPFGIVMAEAFACGCPVIGWRNGSVPEVIDHGKTGFIVESVEEMSDAIRRIATIDRAACRRTAEERFSPDALVSGYLRVIDKLMAER